MISLTRSASPPVSPGISFFTGDSPPHSPVGLQEHVLSEPALVIPGHYSLSDLRTERRSRRHLIKTTPLEAKRPPELHAAAGSCPAAAPVRPLTIAQVGQILDRQGACQLPPSP